MDLTMRSPSVPWTYQYCPEAMGPLWTKLHLYTMCSYQHRRTRSAEKLPRLYPPTPTIIPTIPSRPSV